MKQAEIALTPVQFAAMDAISRRPDMDQAQLAKTIGKDKATIGAVADRLAHKGLVSRSKSATDKRARVLRATKSGTELLARARPIVAALQREILPGLSADEYDAFVSLAAKATLAAEALLDDAH